ncbi:MAG TPA: DegT/DnrJ/EryC1/StrS family aminotransferase [Anaerolineae bacterium]|nr:DegT/DnrJ/EryC1/StrS family aminotransferase [Anaerolineae bacterium]
MSVPFLDLALQYQGLKDDIRPALEQVLGSCAFANGPAVRDFEQSFGEYLGAHHVVCVNSGTSALHLALLAAGVGPGDEVIVPAMTFVATAWAVSYCGARPRFVDVTEGDYTMDPSLVEAAISERTKAVLPVHLYGLPADLDALGRICESRGVPLVEDAAQAHGARYKGRHAGTFGFAGCFSFYAGKNLGAYGEGGAIATDDAEAAERMRALRDHAQRKKYHHDELGFNYRMDSFQGAVLSVKLRHLNEWTHSRQALASRYLKGLADTDLVLPTVPAGREHVWHLFVVLHPERDRLKQALETAGIGCGLHYPVAVPFVRAYAQLGHRPGEFPVAERIARECLSLPIFPEMTEEQQDCAMAGLRQGLAEAS